MLKPNSDGNGGLGAASTAVDDDDDPDGLDQTETNEDHGEVIATVATVAVVGIGAAAFEAALLPGIVLGVAAMWLPQYFPRMGEALNPLFRSTVRGVYKMSHKTREMMAEAQEQVHDIVAEVHAEKDLETAPIKSAAAN